MKRLLQISSVVAWLTLSALSAPAQQVWVDAHDFHHGQSWSGMDRLAGRHAQIFGGYGSYGGRYYSRPSYGSGGYGAGYAPPRYGGNYGQYYDGHCD